MENEAQKKIQKEEEQIMKEERKRKKMTQMGTYNIYRQLRVHYKSITRIFAMNLKCTLQLHCSHCQQPQRFAIDSRLWTYVGIVAM